MAKNSKPEKEMSDNEQKSNLVDMLGEVTPEGRSKYQLTVMLSLTAKPMLLVTDKNMSH